MANLRIRKKLAALNKENCEEHPRSNLAQNLNVPRPQEYYITQVSEKIERGVTKKLSQEFSRTENRIFGALARLDEWIRYFRGTPEPLRRCPGAHSAQTREQMRTSPRVILVLKQATFTSRRRRSPARKMAMTNAFVHNSRTLLFLNLPVLFFFKVSINFLVFARKWYRLSPILFLGPENCRDEEAKKIENSDEYSSWFERKFYVEQKLHYRQLFAER